MHSPELQKFSIFCPMYNERQGVTEFLGKLLEVIPYLGFEDYEILIVDDGSTDGCTQIVELLAIKNPHIRLVKHAKNMGYGAALRTGFLEATGDVVFYTDSDLPIDLWDIKKALPLLADSDLVIGYRIKRHETLRRAIYSRIYNFLMRLLFNVRVVDVNFSFKLVSRSVLKKITLTATSVFIDGQLLAEAVRHHFRITQLPIEYSPRRFGQSSFDSLTAAWRTFSEMIEWRWITLLNRPE